MKDETKFIAEANFKSKS